MSDYGNTPDFENLGNHGDEELEFIDDPELAELLQEQEREAAEEKRRQEERDEKRRMVMEQAKEDRQREEKTKAEEIERRKKEAAAAHAEAVKNKRVAAAAADMRAKAGSIPASDEGVFSQTELGGRRFATQGTFLAMLMFANTKVEEGLLCDEVEAWTERLRAICGLSPATTSGPEPVDLTKEGELGKTTSLFPNLQGQRKRQFFGLGPANNKRPAAGLKERKEGDFL
ncbi:hypothetical protein BJ508DRAFT_327220 [Ascobolus immersus RN42]|uniref:Uncharacterized protein n=1 Tax=Ascobolus immersus RN42 TaxID=1160509 RepID=A0A3N4I3D0_ASCIM|nr:hypothetical protein BJ508DRAFT_327220 [Ascobolus immersus RN42]